MGIKQAVTTVFKGKDNQSKVFNKMGKNAHKFGEKGSKAFKKVSKSATSAGSVMKGVLGAGLVQKAIGGITQGLGAVTTEFLDFDQAITSSSAKFQGLNLATEEGQKTLKALGLAARETGKLTKFSAGEAAAGLEFYATAGFNAAQAMAVLMPTAKLAMASNTDLARTSDIASDAIGIFGLQTKDSVQLQQNFIKMSDQMAFTMTSTNTNMEALFETIKGGGAIFTQAGQKMSTFNAFAGVLAGRGIKGEKAGIALRNMMTSLAKATPEAEDALEKLGVRVRDADTGGFRDMVDIMGDFEKGAKKFGNKDRLALFKTIFGKVGISAFSALMEKGEDGIRKYRTEIEESTGATQKMADIMGKSLTNRLLGLKSAAIEVGFQLFDAFGEKGGNAIDKFTGFVRNINMKPLITGIKTLAGLGKKLFDNFVEIGNRTGLFDEIKKSVENIKPIFETLKGVISDVWGFFKDTGLFDLLAKAFGVLFKAVGPIAKAYDLMWKSIRPILDKLKPILAPIIKFLDFLLDKLGKTLDELDGKLAKKQGKSDVTKLKEAEKEVLATKVSRQWLPFTPGISLSAISKGQAPGKVTGEGDKVASTETKPFVPTGIGIGFSAIKKFIGNRFSVIKKFNEQQKEPEKDRMTAQAQPARQVPPQQNQLVNGTINVNAPEGTTVEQNKKSAVQLDLKYQEKGKPILQAG